jgi:hypothetical protein
MGESALGIFVCALLLAMLAGGIALYRQRRRERERLEARGVTTTARVIVVYSDDSSGRSMTYRFRAEEKGVSVLASAAIDGLYDPEPKRGDEIPVRYDPERPELSRPLPRDPA